MSEIEYKGGYGLQTVGGEFFIVELDGSQQPTGTPLKIIDDAGNAVTSATLNIGTYVPVHAETNGDGTFAVIWRNDAGEYIQRDVDALGEWEASATVLTEADVLNLETFLVRAKLSSLTELFRLISTSLVTTKFSM
jgi:hypothetical protein